VTLAEFFLGGTAVDIVLAMVVVEAVALAFASRLGPRARALQGLGWSMASGGCLVVALRVAVAGGPWPLLAAGIAGSLAAHLMDLRQRWNAARD
jgi:hypothetical protein